MENEKVFNWDAETFFRILTRANKLAQENNFKYCRVSGLQGFEEVLASAQSDTAFVAVQTEDDGYMSLVNSPHTRRVKTVYLAMRYPINRLDLRSSCFSIMQELFRQFRCSVNPNEQQNTDPECAVAADDEDGPDFEKIIEQVDNDPVYEEIFKHLW